MNLSLILTLAPTLTNFSLASRIILYLIIAGRNFNTNITLIFFSIHNLIVSTE